jgi:hypothetical protein
MKGDSIVCDMVSVDDAPIGDPEPVLSHFTSRVRGSSNASNDKPVNNEHTLQLHIRQF